MENENLYLLTDQAIARDIGNGIKKRRLSKNISQNELATKAGISRSTVSEIENGRSGTLMSIIQILRALQELDLLKIFIPEVKISPLQLAKMQGRQRQRASKGRGTGKKDKPEW